MCTLLYHIINPCLGMGNHKYQNDKNIIAGTQRHDVCKVMCKFGCFLSSVSKEIAD